MLANHEISSSSVGSSEDDSEYKLININTGMHFDVRDNIIYIPITVEWNRPAHRKTALIDKLKQILLNDSNLNIQMVKLQYRLIFHDKFYAMNNVHKTNGYIKIYDEV